MPGRNPRVARNRTSGSSATLPGRRGPPGRGIGTSLRSAVVTAGEVAEDFTYDRKEPAGYQAQCYEKVGNLQQDHGKATLKLRALSDTPWQT